MFFFLMTRRTPRYTRPDTLSPSPTLCRVAAVGIAEVGDRVQRDIRHRLAEHHVEGEQVVHRRRRQAAGLGENFRRLQREAGTVERSEEHTSELHSLMRSSYSVFCLTKKTDSRGRSQPILSPDQMKRH